MLKSSTNFLCKLRTIRLALVAYMLIAVIALISTSVLYADDGTEPGADEELVPQPSLQKGNFESDTLSPWRKAPASAPGIIEIESGSSANHTPNGSRNVSIHPDGEVITLRQKINVVSNAEYYLGAFVATESNAQTASLRYGSSICGSTNVVYTNLATNYPLLSCTFISGATQTNVVVKLNGSSTSKEIVSDDWSLRRVPNKTTSRYMKTVSTTTAYNLGCAAANESGVVILSWGHPSYSAPDYGALRYPGNTVFVSNASIAAAAKQWLQGYWNCNGSSVILALGVTNFGSGVNYNHGQAWAQMVNDVDNWIGSNGYRARLQVAAALDSESWNTETVTFQWIDGYDSADTRPYYYFGSCDGCPHTGCQSCSGGPNGWGLDDYRYAAAVAVPALTLPQIYLTNGVNADQWYRMSLRSFQLYGEKIYFEGALTQLGACQTSGNNCAGIDNSPGRGWGQLQHWVKINAATIHTPEKSTDITWQN